MCLHFSQDTRRRTGFVLAAIVAASCHNARDPVPTPSSFGTKRAALWRSFTLIWRLIRDGDPGCTEDNWVQSPSAASGKASTFNQQLDFQKWADVMKAVGIKSALDCKARLRTLLKTNRLPRKPYTMLVAQVQLSKETFFSNGYHEK